MKNNISIVISQPKEIAFDYFMDEFPIKKEKNKYYDEYTLEIQRKRNKKKKSEKKPKQKIKNNKEFSNEEKNYYKDINEKLSVLCHKRERSRKENSINSETSVSSISN